MKAASDVRRWWIAAAAFVVFLVGIAALASLGGQDAESPAPGTTTAQDVPKGSDDIGGVDADEVPSDPRFDAAGRGAERGLGRTSAADAWAIPDAVVRPLSRLWDERRGVYVSPRGAISTRLNAEMLRIHAAAARAGHDGRSRQDGRLRRLVDYLTGPAYVATLQGTRFGDSRHNEIHAPGWRQSNARVVNQHPSIDATVARGLRAAWLARDEAGLSPTGRDAIQRTVVAVASSEAFRPPARLLNQINWNADLDAAAATVSGRTSFLTDDYRAQLTWFAEHADRPSTPGGSPNLTSGRGLRYNPPDGPQTTLNRSDTVEYANIVLGALRYYDDALRAGMRPLGPELERVLRDWATHTLTADWTASGYLNWETGKGGSRLHLRQYWALALDGAVFAARGATRLTGQGTAAADQLLSRGDELFRRWASRAGSVLLPATSFGYPSLFTSVRDNRTTTGVRTAATLAEWASQCACGARLVAPAAERSPIRISYDAGVRRLAVNAPRYSTAISPTAVPTGGGLEPGWVLDAQGRSIAALGGGGPGSLGVRLTVGGKMLMDTQPGPQRARALFLRQVTTDDRAWTGRIAVGPSVIRITHRFLRDRIVTTYLIDPRRPVDVALRIPTAGARGAVRCGSDVAGLGPRVAVPSCRRGQDYVATSEAGASAHVGVLGLPSSSRLTRTRPPSRAALSRPGTQATVRFRISKRILITRVFRPDGD